MSQTSAATQTTITARQIRLVIKGIRYTDVALERLQRFVEYGDLPHAVMTAAYGIQFAQQTGRLCGKANAAVSAMTMAQLAALVADVANACDTVGEVPRYLNARLG